MNLGKGKKLEPINKTIYELIDKNTSNNIAICNNNVNISYKKLKQKTDNIANFIKAKSLYQEGIIMSIDRDENIPLYMLGIMKSGNIYIPLLPDTPFKRFKYIINDTNCKLIITNKKYNNIINNKNTGVEVFYIEDFINSFYSNIVIDNPKYAYIIYTSGTSGTPKGIKFTHYNLSNGMNSYLNVFPKYNSLYSTHIQWDPNFRELFIPLLNNKTVYICNNMLRDEISNKVEWINGIPNILSLIKIPNTVKLITSIGTKITKEYWDNVKHINNIWSLYGPTECLDACMIMKLNKFETTLGNALPNYNIYILKNNKLAPNGDIGEICISSINCAKGYLNNNKLTKEKFIEFNGERVYKTGDLGRWREDNKLEFHGREDNQIKIHGIRIELEEIENCIKNIDNIKDCVVLFKNNRLHCFSTPKNDINIKNHLIDILPKYMIPKKYYFLPSIPLNMNGKVDKLKLLEVLKKNTLNNNIDYKIITNDISEYIYCDFAVIKYIYDLFTDKKQVCLYIKTSENITLKTIFDKLSNTLNPYWVVKINDISLDNLPKPHNANTYRQQFISKHINKVNKNIELDIYEILCENLQLENIKKNVSIDNYGIDSLQFIQLDLLLSKKYKINIYIEDNFNDIISRLNMNKSNYCVFTKNPKKTTNTLLVLFKGGGNMIPSLIRHNKIDNNLFKLNCDFVTVNNSNYVINGTYDDIRLFNELQKYIILYDKIYFISNSSGWKSCVHLSHICNKCLISGALCSESLNFKKETIDRIRTNKDKLLFYYGNDIDKESLYEFENMFSMKINKYKNIFYENKTHGIFNKYKYIDKYIEYLKLFITNKI